VESAILEVIPMSISERVKKWEIDPEKIMQLAKKGFAHPRKLLSSNLEIEPRVLSDLLLNPKARAEDLSPSDWAMLTRKISE
jgi:16S rRNA A1518/A1519 N6-dimethyltransferase RsmA/KsgA/DIM1 with predicted DNA glycosylase/AP lyase activity